MNDFKIHILEELDPETTSIIDDYWSIENGKFLNAPKLIASKNNLKINDLNKLIKANSVCKINHGECEDCGIELIKEITSQSAFKTNIHRKEDRCKNCSDIYWKNIQQQDTIRIQEELELEKEKLSNAIENQSWNELDDIELKILKGIIKYRTKKEIYTNVFGGDPYNSYIWTRVNKIEELGLIKVKRAWHDNKSVDSFEFDERLTDLLDLTMKPVSLPYLSFSLVPNIRKTKPRQPEYSGTFKLSDDVILKAGVKYIYGGWINTDGSINLKFQPESEIKRKVEQTNIEEESDDIRNAINRMNDNNLDESAF